MKIVTGNDLKSGAVVWWTGVDWSILLCWPWRVPPRS